MSKYLFGILSAFLNPISHSWANILDSYLSNKIFERLSTLIFFSSLFGLIFLPIILIIDFPHLIPFSAFIIVFFIALIEVLYQYPYYQALRKGDTSVVASLFSLGKIFIPLFAFLLVSERLHPIQYIGFFIIILSSALLTFDFRKLHFNESLFLMSVVSIILSLQVVLYKYLFIQGISWGSAVFWAGIIQFLTAGIIMLLPKNLKDLMQSKNRLKQIGPLFFLAQFLTWTGNVVGDYAIFLIPVSLVEGIGSTQPIFVLLLAIIFASKAPNIFKEYIGMESIRKKILFFLLIILGVVLITLV